MSYELVVRPEAEQDMQEAAYYYQLQRPGLEVDFLLSLDQALDRVQKNPLSYAVRYQNVRTALLTRFPFLIHYVVSLSTVSVLAVIHSSRNPRNWKDR